MATMKTIFYLTVLLPLIANVVTGDDSTNSTEFACYSCAFSGGGAEPTCAEDPLKDAFLQEIPCEGGQCAIQGILQYGQMHYFTRMCDEEKKLKNETKTVGDQTTITRICDTHLCNIEAYKINQTDSDYELQCYSCIYNPESEGQSAYETSCFDVEGSKDKNIMTTCTKNMLCYTYLVEKKSGSASAVQMFARGCVPRFPGIENQCLKDGALTTCTSFCERDLCNYKSGSEPPEVPVGPVCSAPSTGQNVLLLMLLASVSIWWQPT